MKLPLIYSEEVKQALQNNRPVVALESTIISHGMPYPQNVEVAKEVESMVRMNGATPATIAIINGKVHVGLDDNALLLLAQSPEVMKCSRRDLPYVIAMGKMGATTVAATMIIAEMAGIRIFATGGIGGVHRQAETSWDVSADLIELAQTNVAVVSAGAKAILDLPKTLEYLETFGVPVIGLGTIEFPAFYSPVSGLKLHLRMDTPQEIASFLKVKWQLNLKGGAVIANPIPAENALDEAMIEQAIVSAVEEANDNAIQGKELTPFLLKKLNEVTGGESQKANKALVLHNAKAAAQIAAAFYQ
jgi:pseudouridine-5'-phosphate glycosidase